jgi:hypothetical protein
MASWLAARWWRYQERQAQDGILQRVHTGGMALEHSMNALSSRDGTTIAYDELGEGPALILVDGALTVHSFGSGSELAKLLAPLQETESGVLDRCVGLGEAARPKAGQRTAYRTKMEASGRVSAEMSPRSRMLPRAPRS